MNAQQFVNSLIPHKQPKQNGVGKAPVNIALSKYWGKRNLELNLPTNSSVSISLPGLGTETQLSCQLNSQDSVTLNGQCLPQEDKFAKRLSAFLN
jgi:diphosphomevalonate decarboxylase